MGLNPSCKLQAERFGNLTGCERSEKKSRSKRVGGLKVEIQRRHKIKQRLRGGGRLEKSSSQKE